MKVLLIPFDSGAFSVKGSADATRIVEGEKLEVASDNIEETQKTIYEKMKDAVKKDKILAIGGDHSTSYPLIKAFMEEINGCVLYLDAHADADVYFKPPSYEDVVNVLFADKVVNNLNFAFVGLSKVWRNEKEFLNKHKIRIFEPEEVNKIKEFVGGRKLYLSLDIDFFSKKYVAATGHADGKASPDEFFHILDAVKENLACCDVVEYNPLLDKDGKTKTLFLEIIRRVKDLL